jgi:hypothetical protein
MARNNFWVNDDGLAIGFGTRTSVEQGATTVNKGGNTYEMTLVVPDLLPVAGVVGTDATAYTAGSYSNAAFIPALATVQKVTIVTDTVAASTGAADILLGLYTIHATTGALVVVDADGLVDAGSSVLADFSVVGETMIIDKATGGTYVGKKTVGASPVLIAAITATEVYSAGALTFIVEYTTTT